MRKNWFIWIPILFVVLLAFSNGIVSLWVDWLWFQELGYPVLFTRQLMAQWSLGAAFGVFFFHHTLRNGFNREGSGWARSTIKPLHGH